MQLRKLIRLLKEAEKKHGGHIECCIDAEYARSYPEELNYISIPDVKERDCIWNRDDTKEENWRTVLVLGK